MLEAQLHQDILKPIDRWLESLDVVKVRPIKGALKVGWGGSELTTYREGNMVGKCSRTSEPPCLH